LVHSYKSIAALASARSLFTIPAPISHSLPICCKRDGQMVGRPPLARTEDPFDLRGEALVQRSSSSRRSISRRGRSIFHHEAPLLFPRLGEINSRCLRVFATGGISPFIDRRPFDRVLLLISAGILRDKLLRWEKEEKT